MFGEAKSHIINYVTIENIFIKKVRKQLFLTKLMMGIILRRGGSRDK